jgi:hypothetical protein
MVNPMVIDVSIYIYVFRVALAVTGTPLLVGYSWQLLMGVTPSVSVGET